MTISSRTGYVHTAQHHSVYLRTDDSPEKRIPSEALKPPFDNPLSYFAAVIQGRIKPTGLSSLENNMIVTEILDAARRSAESGKTINLN